ncbi:MAG: hypothetical protein Q9176_005466 [Flavoplaca citrina]
MSTTSKPPKPPTSIPSTSSLHPLTALTGTHPLTLGPNTYIHLRAILSTTQSPITVGAHCIIGEKAVVGQQQTENDGEENAEERGVVLEDHVTIEPNAVVEASRIGTGTVVGVGARIGKGTLVGKFCKINALCTVAPYKTIPDHTVIYGHNERRVDRSGMEELRMRSVEQQVEVLKRAEFAVRKK